MFSKEQIEQAKKSFTLIYTKEEVQSCIAGFEDEIINGEYIDLNDMLGSNDSLYDLEQGAVADILTDFGIDWDDDDYEEMTYYLRDEVGYDILENVYDKLVDEIRK